MVLPSGGRLGGRSKVTSSEASYGAICSVFGDPHYRTFDGRIFNFQGTCDYILAQTRDHNEITVIVRNDARLNEQYAWTKSIRIQVGGAKIYFLQKSRVKVNRKRVVLPYVHRRSKFSVVTDGRLVALKTPSGIKVSWDGDSYLEVYVPRDMKNAMRGLCGNYNNDRSDDFIGQGGALYVDAEQFANTWLTGRRRCRRNSPTSVNVPSTRCQSDQLRLEKAKVPCTALYGKGFERCRSSLEVEQYFSSCITDMCECDNGTRCFCVSILAYVRACTLMGFDVQRHLPAVCKGVRIPKHVSGLLISLWESANSLFVRDKYVTPTGKRLHAGYVQKVEARKNIPFDTTARSK
ncbi:hypothetical protein LSH36_291g06001 [Paralvinella palmiformis]|uniref:VWFD domain-containing protein n=1 Tax=Paralvinella palmiformis TaxID=53620 RepID=A0AAD9JJ16_9ANNE|nr:hypothetical protein LSH36_291g06001 [Paralvinella palmiformis]